MTGDDDVFGDLRSLAVRRRGPVAEVTLVGPGKGNAMGPDFWREVPAVFAAIDDDPAIRAVVVTGGLECFSVGLDLWSTLPSWQFALQPGARAEPRTRFMRELRYLQAGMNAVAECRTPVVAAVCGWCVGGGVDLISTVDVRVASADATFSIREVKMAIVADVGSLQRLPAIIGQAHTRELALTGRNFDASHAESIGLVSQVCPDPEATIAKAHEIASEIAANPPLVTQGIKEVLNESARDGISAGLRFVSTWNAAFMPSDDMDEAVDAFSERRPPEFHGR